MPSMTFGLRGESLVFPNSHEPFIVYSDTSKMNLRCTLMLKDLVREMRNLAQDMDEKPHSGYG
ncbi:hypothetical protein CR513_61128, partial [Mucuna pruriens]